jgi:HEAT repeat protein
MHSEELAREVIKAAALKAIIACLKDPDPNVKEEAAYVVANIATYLVCVILDIIILH